MKTLSSLALLVAVIALPLLSLSVASSMSMLFVAGLAAVLVADYARPVRLQRVGLGSCAARRAADFRLAA